MNQPIACSKDSTYRSFRRHVIDVESLEVLLTGQEGAASIESFPGDLEGSQIKGPVQVA